MPKKRAEEEDLLLASQISQSSYVKMLVFSTAVFTQIHSTKVNTMPNVNTR